MAGSRNISPAAQQLYAVLFNSHSDALRGKSSSQDERDGAMLVAVSRSGMQTLDECMQQINAESQRSRGEAFFNTQETIHNNMRNEINAKRQMCEQWLSQINTTQQRPGF